MGGTSLRAITSAAGLAPASASYHFGSKEGLVLALLEKRGDPVRAQTAVGLESLALRRRDPTIREVVVVILQPYLDLLAEDPEGGLRWVKFLAQLVISQDPQWLEFFGLGSGLGTLFTDLLRRASPLADAQSIRRRATLAMHALVTSLSHLDAPALAGSLGPDGIDSDFARELVAFTSAGLRGR